MLIFQSLFELPLAVYSLAGTVAVMIGAVSFMGSCVWAPQGHLCREALGYPVHASASNLSGISQCIEFRELGYAPLRTTQQPSAQAWHDNMCMCTMGHVCELIVFLFCLCVLSCILLLLTCVCSACLCLFVFLFCLSGFCIEL